MRELLNISKQSNLQIFLPSFVCSVSELAHSSGNSASGVRGVLEGHVVAGAPRELGAETSVDTILNVGLGGDVADFLLGSLELLEAGVELGVLKEGELVDVADVAHGLHLVEVLSVVDEVEHEVVLHGDVEGLHLLGLGTAAADSGVDGVFSLHEGVVFGLDAVNNIGSVDGGTVTIPVDGAAVTSVSTLVVVVEDTLELSMSITSVVSGGTSTNSLEPVGSKVLACLGKVIVRNRDVNLLLVAML